MINKEKIEQAVKLLLEGMGEDVTRTGLVETPERVARMYEEILSGYDDSAERHLGKTFPVAESGMILEKDIQFYSLCEHHLLPFFGKVHIAYVPVDEVVGISKLLRTVEVFARRLQIQEQMTAQIADAIAKNLKTKGVMVLVEAEHMCVSMRGIKKSGSKTVTVASRGCFENDQNLRDTFFKLIS
ncbi:MAG: GTP cyclohydrolase I FolE [Butyrivibrio sp.]|nr:GTP cyclohydrolase I FolE [Butyrivibrio sp.]